MTTLPERPVELIAILRDIAAGRKNAMGDYWHTPSYVAEAADRLEAATALQSPALSGEVVAYWVPNARVMSDGSYEDGPGYLVPIDEATQHERQHGAPLYLASPAQDDGWVRVPRQTFDFLNGTGELFGCGFGEIPTGERGKYWWRNYLTAAPSASLDVAGGG